MQEKFIEKGSLCELYELLCNFQCTIAQTLLICQFLSKNNTHNYKRTEMQTFFNRF